MFIVEVEVNEYGTNKKIKGHILNSRKMKELGFREEKDSWVYFRELDSTYEISITVKIYKENSDNVNIMVIDDDFGQPYAYQRILMKDANQKVAKSIWKKVEAVMLMLTNNQIITGHIMGEYI